MTAAEGILPPKPGGGPAGGAGGVRAERRQPLQPDAAGYTAEFVQKNYTRLPHARRREFIVKLQTFWSGHCRPVSSVSCRCARLQQVFPFPILHLQDVSPGVPEVRIFPDTFSMREDLSLGDVISDEFGIEIAQGSCIVVTAEGFGGGLEGSFRVVTEILHAAIVSSDARQEIGIFDWALRSFTRQWRSDLCAEPEVIDRLAASHLALITGWQPGALTLSDYLTLIEPDYRQCAPDPELADRLRDCTQMSAFWAELARLYPGGDGEAYPTGAKERQG